PLEFRFEKILPLRRDPVFRNDFPMVGDDMYRGCIAQDVPFSWMYHFDRNFEDSMLGHAKDVILHQIRRIRFAQFNGYMSDVPSPGFSCLDFQRKPLVSIFALDSFNLDVVYKRILLLERVNPRFEIRAIQTAADLEFSLLLCHGYDLIVSSKQNITSSLS